MGAGARASHNSNKTKQKRYKTIPLTLVSGPMILLGKAGSSKVSREVMTINPDFLVCYVLFCVVTACCLRSACIPLLQVCMHDLCRL